MRVALAALAALTLAACGLGDTEAAAAPLGSSFRDVTAAKKMDAPLRGMYAHAAAVGDVNADGWDDLFVGGFSDYPDDTYRVRGASGRAPDRLFLGGSKNLTMATNFPVTFGRTSSALFADLENTGYPDLVIVRHTLPSGGYQANAPTVVLHNDSGRFGAPQALPGVVQGRSAVPLDYDGDGLLDLFVTHDDYFGRTGPSVLLRNRGGLSFEDRTAAAGLTDVIGFGAAAGDLNGDGRTDLVVSDTSPGPGETSSPAARVFLNDGTAFREIDNSAFTWATHGVEDHVTGATIADLNRDGRLDVAISHHFETTAQHPTPVRIYLNQPGPAPDGITFTDVTSASGLPAFRTKAPDLQVGDLDNDGLPDLVVTAGATGDRQPAMFRATGIVNGVPRYEPTGTPSASAYWLNAALLDYDHDGRLDVFTTEFDPARPSLLFRNETGGTRHWLDIAVTGPGGGVGSRVEVYRAGAIGQASALLGVGEVAAASGLGTGLRPSVHVGLGSVTSVDIIVRPPRGGPVRQRKAVKVDRRIRI